MLLLRPNRTVAQRSIVDAIWADHPPRDATGQVHGTVYRLRKRLTTAGAPHSIITEATGYRAPVDPPNVDLVEFRRLRDQARAAAADNRSAEAKEQYRAALALWRGPALDGLDSDLIRTAAATLDEERIQASEECLGVELALGAAGELVAEITDLIQQHPYREGLRGKLMLALYRTGRHADALAAYRQAHRLMRDELGTEPGPDLQELHQAILNRDPDLAQARATNASTALPEPWQLPADTDWFTGRTAELRVLDDMLSGPATDPPTRPTTSAITGMAGVGKTALAVHWAHRVAHRYPDGQLFIDLRGYTQGLSPLEPDEALDRVLRTLGVAGERIPSHVDERAALYRSRLASRRMIIVLDNATEGQVQPLLPNAPGCLVLVTSRHSLTGLDFTHMVFLDTLPLADGVTLLTRASGTHRLNNQPPRVVAEIVELCGRLPLAIRIAAARLRSHPAWGAGHLAERLRGHQRRLAELEAGQRSVAASLDVSYRQLTTDQRRAYCLLRLHPGPDFDSQVTAAITRITVAQAERLLDQLQEANLLLEFPSGRYKFHDLTRVHAARVATSDESENERRVGLVRLFDFYRQATVVAASTVYPHEGDGGHCLQSTDTDALALHETEAASAWLDAELSNLLAVAYCAAEVGRPEYTLYMSNILHQHLRTCSRYRDAETLHSRALEIVRASGDRGKELNTLTHLGHIRRLQGRCEQAIDDFARAREIAREIDNREDEMRAVLGIGRVQWKLGQHERARHHHQHALQIARNIGNRSGELEALNGLGNVCSSVGWYEEAAEYFMQSAEIAGAAGHRGGELDSLSGLAFLYRAQGQYEHAADHYQRVLEIARIIGHRVAEAEALIGLAYVHQAQHRNTATEYLEQALEVARVAGHIDSELKAMVGVSHILQKRGRHEQAATHYQQALERAREVNSDNWQFEAAYGLGRLHHATGHPDIALGCYQQAYHLATQLGQLVDQARVDDGLATAYRALGRPEQARQHWKSAISILTGLGIACTEDEVSLVTIRAHLAAIGQPEEPTGGPRRPRA